MSEEKDKLYKIRHTLAHLLAKAALEYDPNAKITLGPPVDNGFYYDIDFSKEVSDKQLKEFEKKMRSYIKKGFKPVCKEISYDEAKEMFKDNPYKLELIEEIHKNGEKITTYEIADFVDLCEGPHVESSEQIDPQAFKLDKIAGAYWRGDENNKMLTRIYGLAFESKEDLDKYLAMREEAKKRDHRKLGKELDLFTFSELVGPGLPLWTEKGTLYRQLLDSYIWSLRSKYGYKRVTIPHITKRDLYEKSGHWEKYADDLFKIKTREGKEYALKPMNCPHHTQIYARKPHSYKELPVRYAETTMVYRDEQSGEVGGLTRVLSITQDDSHIFCRSSQIKQEILNIWNIIEEFYGSFGFTDLKVRLSFRDESKKEDYLGSDEVWSLAQNALRELAKEKNAEYFEAQGEAAFYGPKLDFMAKDAIGREHQVATIQLDFNLPERFDLYCINEEGEKERIVMIHSAIAGSLERFTAVLLEHTAGKLPLWLSPVQVYILPVAEVHEDFANEVLEKLQSAGVRAELLPHKESLGKRIRQFKKDKVPFAVVLGDKEKESGILTIENRDSEEKLQLSVDEFIDKIKKESKI